MSARARVALNLMIDEGSVSTVRLKNMGYNHPPRVLADLKDAGVPFVMKRIHVDGEPRPVAAYWLVDHVNADGETPRKPIPKWFKDKLLAEWHNRCAVCRGEYTARVLQPDHRIPFRIGVIQSGGIQSFSCRSVAQTIEPRVGPARHVRIGSSEMLIFVSRAIGHPLTSMLTLRQFPNGVYLW
jgi:hypothetical protein